MLSDRHIYTSYNFTFWKLIRGDDGTYTAKPYIIIYPSARLIEIHPHTPPTLTPPQEKIL